MTTERPETFAATIAALTAVMDECAERDDRAGYFAAMYLAVTRTVKARASAGAFEDPARMERFASRFAGRYLDAYDGWRAGEPISGSWEVAFRTARRWWPIALQHLLLGMNAHINLDLGVTAAGFAGPGGLAEVRSDFDAINGVLSDLVDACQGAVGAISPWMALVDRTGGSGDEAVLRFSLVLARRQAWDVAERLHALPPETRDTATVEVDTTATQIARRVCRPGFRGGVLLVLVRLRERHRPHEVIEVLDAVAL